MTTATMSESKPQFSNDPALEEEWQAFKADLDAVRSQLDEPWLSQVDGRMILDLITRQIELVRRTRAGNE